MNNILFDLDGTLTDPQEGILGCIEHALTKLNAPIPPRTQLTKYIGPSLWESFKEMLNTDSDEKAQEAVLLYRERFSTVGLYENSPYEGIHETLENLSGSGRTLFICTSKPGVYARQIAEHFGFAKYFKEIYGSRLDGTLVDKTKLIAHILKTETLAPAQTAMVGDRKYDINGAVNNSLTPFGVSYGFGSAEELADAVCIFDTPKCISKHFLR